ncbi:DUF4817 domain-containing protein [Trichonephila clavipes]|nr:DUF4817 domain-containing protein [Trichonephila clavipes]
MKDKENTPEGIFGALERCDNITERGARTSFSEHVLVFVGREDAWLRFWWKGYNGICEFPPVSVSKMLWSRQQRTFAVGAYFSNGRAMIAVQCAFRRRFDIPPKGHVPNLKCVLLWNDAFRATEKTSKER